MMPARDRDAVCCGEGGSHTTVGEPLVPGCALCPNSPTYWRRPENRADGCAYEPAQPLIDTDARLVKE